MSRTMMKKKIHFTDDTVGQSLADYVRKKIPEADFGGDFRESIRKLTPQERRKLRRAVGSYQKSCMKNVRIMQNELTVSALKNAKGAVKIIGRGAAAGISAAGVVNTVAPGLFSTSLGYIAGSMRGTGFLDICSKLGLVTVGAFTPPALTQGAILVCGAVIGIAVYAVCAAVKKVFTFRR